MQLWKVSATALALGVAATGVAICAPMFLHGRAVSATEPNPTARRRMATIQRHWRNASTAIKEKDYTRAETSIKQGLAIDARTVEPYLPLARVYEAQGLRQEALTAYCQLVRPPQGIQSSWAYDPATLFHYAQLNLDAGYVQEADWAAARAFANPTSSLGNYTTFGVPLLNLLPPFQGSALNYPDFGAVARLMRAVQARDESVDGVQEAVRLLEEAQRLARTDQTRALIVYERAETLQLLWSLTADLPAAPTSQMARVRETEGFYKEAARLDRGRNLLRPFLVNKIAPVYLKEIYGKAVTGAELDARSVTFRKLAEPQR